jgi:hypothetical protein
LPVRTSGAKALVTPKPMPDSGARS